ncbi:hypothetical protein VT06_13375 [Arsukibacterium sp. MJ3]|uniref:ATP-binding protein n=1 Tax=Arsukibacterium sp. MJ3 TaxID=1632859 RepID=UPI000626F451|nr:type IV secretion system DNA-binding domain-containing protein [Arsukibacterium sp. MJ3]KKO48095.1 hypothetical protein VT06_13375 [Arsukibacterium sp. MJ3]
MNLFVKSLDDYLKESCIQMLHSNLQSREARFIVQSMGPEEAFELFASLENFQLEQQKNHSLKCYLRISTGLWNEWCRELGGDQELQQTMSKLGAIGFEGERLWIDEEDKLTWYRNRTVHDEGTENLIIVLVGLNHATDQGGLSDFHKVDEAKIWHKMKKSFIPWLNQLCLNLGIDASESALEPLNSAFCELIQLRPLTLITFARFIQKSLVNEHAFYSLEELVERFYYVLPFWGIPPILFEGYIGQKGSDFLKQADKFISHQIYKTERNQKKDWAKIEKWIASEDFVLPTVINAANQFITIEDYLDVLKRFIFEADERAHSKLLSTDILPLLKTLNIKDAKEKKSKKTTKSFNSSALESFLSGIKDTLVSYKAIFENGLIESQIEKIVIEIVHFDHDMVADHEDSIDSRELAETLLIGCLGGLDSIFEELNCCLPCDHDEALLSSNSWTRELPVSFCFDLENLSFRVSHSRPKLLFRVLVMTNDKDESFVSNFYWQIPSTQPERVMAECVRLVRQKWLESNDSLRLLPAFRIPAENMSAIFYASDEEEANRLLSQSITDFEIINLIEDLPTNQLELELNNKILTFTTAYKDWLDIVYKQGFYTTVNNQLNRLLQKYIELMECALTKKYKGSQELLRRLYKAFFIVEKSCQPNDSYLSTAIAWGLSPAVLEQMNAKVRFLIDGFPEVLSKLVVSGDYEQTFNRLLDLSQIKRPISALVNSENTLSADIKSYGLLHYLGFKPESEISLAVQTLLREVDNDDDGEIKESIRPSQETKIVSNVIKDYMKLYPHSHDGLSILAVNIKDLQTILSGLDYFLEKYLTESDITVDFHFTVMIYTCSSSPMVMENRLKLWQEQLKQRFDEKNRGVQLSIGHKFSSKKSIVSLLENENKNYDIAFLFHFLEDGLKGRIDQARAFEFSFDDCSFFPVAEYPRPINLAEKYIRQNLISNRRLRAQTRHADMSARLCYNGQENSDHIIYGRVDFQPWIPAIEALHNRGYWVACIDPFVDKKMLITDHDELRNIVGFSSGLGSFGELNLTVSSQRGKLTDLVRIITSRLKVIFKFENITVLETMSVNVVKELEKIVGLTSLRAVVGDGEQIREVIGFAAIHRALKAPKGVMSQLLPLDDFKHWFADNETNLRPDLLQMTLELRENDIPLIHANLVECKLAKTSNDHLNKALEQINVGLTYLPSLLAPKTENLNTSEFDRRYWWAQLHRALSSRTEIQLSQDQWRELDYALEQIADGEFEIHWRSSIFTFWTDDDSLDHSIKEYLPSSAVISSGFKIDNNFSTKHVTVGYKVLSKLLSDDTNPTLLDNSGSKITIRASKHVLKSGNNNSIIPSNDVGLIDTLIATGTSSEKSITDHEVDSINKTKVFADNIINCEKESKTETEKNITILLPSEQIDISSSDMRAGQSPTISIKSHVPEKILIGERMNSEPVYWNFGHPQLANRHLLIFGSSGSGKTYGIQCLLSELAKQKVRSFIIDYTNGFMPDQVEKCFKDYTLPEDHFVKLGKLPLNPFRKQRVVINPSMPAIEDSSFDVASRISSIFKSVFPTIGDQQYAALIKTLTAGLDNDLNFNFEKLLTPLREENKQGDSLANKLQPFVDSKLFSDSNDQAWEQMLQTPNNWVHVLQLVGLNRDIQKIVTEFALWDLWDYVQSTGNKDRPIPVVLDEIQNLDHSDGSPIDKMLREGRKFGLSLILATQTTSQFNQEQRDRLFQAGHKLFFKPATTEVDRFAQILAQSTPNVNKAEWVSRLSKLQKGQCWSLGPVEKSNGNLIEEPVLISVTSLENRVFGV